MPKRAAPIEDKPAPVAVVKTLPPVQPIVPFRTGNLSLTDAEDLLKPFCTEKTLRNWRDKRGCAAIEHGKGGVHLGKLMQWIKDEAEARHQIERDAVFKTAGGAEIDVRVLSGRLLAADVRLKELNIAKIEREQVPLAVVVQAVGMLVAQQTAMLRNLENLGNVMAAETDADVCRRKIREKTEDIIRVFNLNTLAKAENLESLADGPPSSDEGEDDVFNDTDRG